MMSRTDVQFDEHVLSTEQVLSLSLSLAAYHLIWFTRRNRISNFGRESPSHLFASVDDAIFIQIEG